MKIPHHERRRHPQGINDFLHDARQSVDPETGLRTTKIFSGDWYVATQRGEMIATILGSCIAACIRDPVTGVGGMNHFLLPGETGDGITSASARYGTNAMEQLINAILAAGARRERLEIKVFGGGNVTNNSARIGSKNAAFIRDFLKREHLPMDAEDLEGELPRRVHYFPDTGRTLVRKLHRKEDFAVVQEEETYAKQIIQQPDDGEIELFG